MFPFRLLPLAALILVSACASAPTAPAGPPKGFVAADAPFIADKITEPAFLKQFAIEKCGMPEGAEGRSRDELKDCDSKLQDEFKVMLSRVYFATDRDEISLRCKKEWLDCANPKILETWIRESHNHRLVALNKASTPERSPSNDFRPARAFERRP